MFSRRYMRRIGAFCLSLALLCILVAHEAPGYGGTVRAEMSGLALSASASPASVPAGQGVAYTISLRNTNSSPALDVTIAHTLPPGFAYVRGSARIVSNHTLVSTRDPVATGQTLTWAGLSVPAARSAGFYGMHTFVQDRCESEYIRYQLDRVRELMGAGAFVKQLFYRIGEETRGPQACWIEFVNACYNRDLIPVVRLQGEHNGAHWVKPRAASPGDYSAIAAAYARVVAGLPRRDNRPLYVEIWNEPNLDSEWSGQANPVEYGHFLVDVTAALHALGDARIQVLNGGLSPGGNYHYLGFIDAMSAVPGVMSAFDVWATHPYPDNHPPEYNNHDGTATDYRELTIDGYLLELERLANHGRTGVRVLLTETGYALGQNGFLFQDYPPINEGNRADYIARAFRDYWSRWPEVLGVCPYELVDPYGSWSVWDWLAPDGSHHQQYDAVAALDKRPPLAESELILTFRVVASGAPGSYPSQVVVTSSNAGAATLNPAAPVQVLLPPPTATPTPTPTPPGTPTQTPTPSPTPICYSIVQDGGFEQDGVWEIPSTAYSAGYSEAVVHNGGRALRVGIAEGEVGPEGASYSSAQQGFYVPLSASSVRIHFWIYALSQDTLHDWQYVLLLDADKQYETILRTVSDAREWRAYTYEVASHAGETLWLRFGAYNDGTGGNTAMYVDDVEVLACGPTGFVTLTPMPSATPTPSPTTTPSATSTASPTPSPSSTASPSPSGTLRPATTATPSPTITVYPTRRSAWLPLILRPEGSDYHKGHREYKEEECKMHNTPCPLCSPGWDPSLDASEMLRFAQHDHAVPARALVLDSLRGRVLMATDDGVTALDAHDGHTLWRRNLPAPAGALAVEEATGTLYVALPARGELVALRPDGTLRARVAGLGRPTGLAVAGGRIYVADSALWRLLGLDSMDCGIMSQQRLSAAPHALAVDSRAGRLYVGLMGNGTILALHAETLDVVGQVSLGGLGYPRALALDAEAGRLYVAHALSPKYGAISSIDTATFRLLTTLWGNSRIPLTGVDTLHLTQGGAALIAGQLDGLVTLDAQSLELRGALKLRRSGWGGGVAVDALARSVYVAGSAGEVWRFD